MDGTSFGVLLATVADILPPVAAALSIVWVCIRIYETETVQKWLEKHRGPPQG